MPNYDFVCADDHITEKFVPLSEWQDGMTTTCEKCGKPAEQSVLPRGATTAIRPFVYYLTPGGEIRVPGTSERGLPVPKGFQRCEITTFGELRSLERRLSRQEQSKVSLASEMRDYQDAQDSAQDRSDMRDYLRSGMVPEIDQAETARRGEVVFTGRMKEISPAARDLMQRAIERSNSKRRFQSHDTGLHLYILHNEEGRSRDRD